MYKNRAIVHPDPFGTLCSIYRQRFSPALRWAKSQAESDNAETWVGVLPSQIIIYWQIEPDNWVKSTVTMFLPFFPVGLLQSF